ncbi:DsbA family oxidoreductase [Propionicimonas sp.]|uniref:DsbA family oxidoreductase n=1 Tax=Propionicimonas sp. TaxID=1955623 RepID=UPI0039E627E5
MRIDIWSDIACPWCYIGLTRFGRALARFEHADDVEVELHSYQLDPTLPESFDGTEADYLAASKGIDVADVHAMTAQVSAAAATEGLTLDFDSLVVTNPRRAHRLLQYAKGVSGQAAWDLELALLTAHFADGLSISDPDTVSALADGVGIAPDAARAALDSAELDAAVGADVRAAAQLGIRGVPFFVLDEKYGVSGAQPPELFDRALQQVWDEEHSG